jgi:hypothetical protein
LVRLLRLVRRLRLLVWLLLLLLWLWLLPQRIDRPLLLLVGLWTQSLSSPITLQPL